MLVRKGLKAWLTYEMCVARAVPCMGGLNLSEKWSTYYFVNGFFFMILIVIVECTLSF